MAVLGRATTTLLQGDAGAPGAPGTSSSGYGKLMKIQRIGTLTTVGVNNSVGCVAPTVTGTPTAVTDTTNGVMVRYTTGAVAGNTGGWQHADTEYTAQDLPDFFAVVALGATQTLVRTWVAITSGGLAADNVLTGRHACAFRFSSVTPDTNWQCLTNNATTATVTDSGVAGAGGTSYRLRIRYTNATTVVFSINGTDVVTTSATLPAGSTQMGFAVFVETLTTAARVLDIRKLEIRANQ